MNQNLKPLPEHPGRFMKLWLLPAKNLTPDDLSHSTGLPLAKIQSILDEKSDIEEDVALALSKEFGCAAETLYRMQKELSIFNSTGKIPSQDLLPKLKL